MVSPRRDAFDAVWVLLAEATEKQLEAVTYQYGDPNQESRHRRRVRTFMDLVKQTPDQKDSRTGKGQATGEVLG
jgi:hypothetical protein